MSDAPVKRYAVKEATAAKFVAAGVGELSDSEVAERLGCTPERVRQVRIALGLPMNAEAKARRIKAPSAARHAALAEQARALIEADPQSLQTYGALAARLGVSASLAARILQEASLTLPNRKRRPSGFWPQVDWAKTNAQIAAETGADVKTVSAQRSRLSPRKALDNGDECK